MSDKPKYDIPRMKIGPEKIEEIKNNLRIMPSMFEQLDQVAASLDMDASETKKHMQWARDASITMLKMQGVDVSEFEKTAGK